MLNTPILPVDFIKSLEPSQFTKNSTLYSNPDLFRLMLAQKIGGSPEDFDILFGENKDNDDSLFGISSIHNPITNTNFAASPAMEMIAKANLIGKNVQAINPENGETFEGKVGSISSEGGTLLINVGGVNIPPENLVTIKQ